jgi:hypothetical protein
VRPFHQVRLDAECVTQLVCQADGLAGVVSWFAPDDLCPHRCLHVYLTDVPSAPATRNTPWPSFPTRRPPWYRLSTTRREVPKIRRPAWSKRRLSWPASFVS